jgi:glucose-6-phosphate-specific signal transduction histidine kinase
MEEWIVYPSFFVYLLFFVNILLLTIGVYQSILQKHTYAWYVVASFIPHILWGLNMILIAFQIIDMQLSVDWISVIILYEMLLFGWILIRDYIDAFRLSQELQGQLILEEKKSNDRIEGARIKERRMIADILHDKIGVDIAHTAHLIEMNQHSDAYNNLMSLGMNIRNLSHTILPKALEDGALVSALKSQIEIMNVQNQQSDISFDDYDFPKIVPLDFAYTFYLVSLELIQNAIRHGKAKNIVIEFYAYPNELVLSFNDDGIGFDANEEFGFGLYNAQRRIKELNGVITIDSTTEAGTSILISMPYGNTHS